MSTTNNESPVAHNSYFDGTVQSLALATDKGKATVGVMKPGKYTFGTAAPEEMIVVAGELNVKLPGEDWAVYYAHQPFSIAANQSFDVSCDNDVAYICYYG
ncbi:hypothetical protein BDD43_1667 [Mucilaginibacter gracilis]|uniref:Pyrimidine/purine nucleoside phosphorylase n=1 Tax=Mucilaginibacter gracilis TaxID=423350 RepID=A0A495IXU8_9SPHI|nr:pyrimidine/purine nucleoside phosphorylase [Mucilaginibacter gracilis]RKR81520.1 hypothetical protein BDD43_1667 [Mucilaginibacter gracilis]